jgi:hypothetical protein
MIFEKQEDLDREKKAIDLFSKTFGWGYEKLGLTDVDFKLTKNGALFAYAEVKGRLTPIKDAFPLPIAVRKLVKLMDKRIHGIIIWACNDGIIYADAKKITGGISWGGRAKREGSVNDNEFMAYFENAPAFKYIKYTK